jgi:hypothetical protein
MGPIIPNGLILEEWNNVIAIIIGIAFGYILEASGFSSSRKLAGVFYGYDFAVLKVFLTAGVVALIGLFYLDFLGILEFTQLYVHPTYLWGAIIGGMVMGIGFVAGGFCPGTSLAAFAIGKLDAWMFIGGTLIGVFIFAEFYPLFEGLYAGSYLGNVTLMDSFGVNPYLIVFGFTVAALLLFFLADYVRRRTKKVFY